MRSNVNTDLMDILEDKNEIIFGPFIGEYGWEIFRWSGFIRWYKKKYPEKRIIVSTRKDRRDMYVNSFDEIDLFELEGDYTSRYSPNCYASKNFPKNVFQELIDGLKNNYPNAYIFHPYDYGCRRDIFSFEQMDYEFETSKTSKMIISQLLSQHPNKIPISLSTRNRTDTSVRNWGIKNWYALIDLLNNSNKYVIMTLGKSPSYVKPNKKHNNFIDIENYVSDELSTTHTGLTIEAIKNSKITVGIQTGNIILSNLIGTPTLFWGHEVKRHSVDENPKNTLSKGFYDPSYNLNPVAIFNNINEMIGKLK